MVKNNSASTTTQIDRAIGPTAAYQLMYQIMRYVAMCTLQIM